jgi:hypothetical protein
MTALKPRTATIVIYQGDDMTTLTELRRAAETARQFEELARGQAEAAREVFATNARAGDDIVVEDAALAAAETETKARQDEYDAFVDEAAERAVTIELHSIGKKRFRDLMAAHPPRKVTETIQPGPDADEDATPTTVERVHPDDAALEVNTETFPDALLTFIDEDDPEVRTIGKPDLSGRKAVTAFVDNDLAEGDYDGIWTAAYWLNRAPSADPKASKYSGALRST